MYEEYINIKNLYIWRKRIMPQYNITAIRYGFITIDADSEKEALEIASELSSDDFEWSDELDVTIGE